MEVVSQTHAREVLEEIGSWESIFVKDVDLYKIDHDADLGAVGSGLRNQLFAYEQAAAKVFAAARGVVPECVEAAQQHYEPAYRGERMAKVAEVARTRFRPLLPAWDREIEQLVAKCAKTAYPVLPAGADEQLLRGEAEMLLAKARTPYHGLAALTASERRDLAALALSPWASSWASVHGMTTADLGAVRRSAIEAAKTLGTEKEQAAAKLYRDTFALVGLRPALQRALEAACALFGDARGLGFKGGYVASDEVDLMVWKDTGPLDFPPLTKMAS